MMKKISVIIPVYNGSKYIIRCLESLRKQTYREYEIIIVNDGSTDDSLKLVQAYKEKYLNELDMFIYDQENAGIAKTRNKGIVHSTGEYIVFSDQDDYMEEDYLEKLFEAIWKNQADIVVTGYNRVSKTGKIKRNVPIANSEWGKFLNIAPWGKIFRKSFIIENGLTFLDVKKGEDIYFTVNAYCLTNKVVAMPYVGYNWVDNEVSVSNTLHKEIGAESSIIPLLDKLFESVKGQQCIPRKQLEYFFIKSVIYEMLYCSRGKRRSDVKLLYDRLINWLDEKFPNNINNELVKFTAPEGEMWYTRVVIKIFWILRNLHMAKLFLEIYSIIFRNE